MTDTAALPPRVPWRLARILERNEHRKALSAIPPPVRPPISSKRRPSHPLAQAMLAAVEAHEWDGGYIYFIRCEQFVKVGHSCSPVRRVADMAWQTPFDLQIVKVVAGSVAAEKVMHRALAAFHHRNEWFWLKPELADAIKQLPGNRYPKSKW